MRIAIYGLTIFLSALLSFAVQPMVGKALLPLLGGVPGTWTACLLFFQAALLVGYGYVWLGARLAPRVRVVVHLAAVAVPLAVVAPFAFPEGPGALSPADHPIAFALAYLALNVGVPFTVLSATAPLCSHWYAHVSGERPYFLYAASNVGSLGALLAYPILVEPFLDLAAQAIAFRLGFAGVAAGLVLVGLTVWRAPRKASVVLEDAPPPTWRRRASWVGLSLVPTALLAGASAHVSLDVAAVPLLWVVPLALYLGSFILAFSDRVPAPPAWVGRGTCLVAVVLVLFVVTHRNDPVWLLVTLHLLVLAGGSWLAHHRLARDAPHPRHLPEFFGWIALGGVLGTLIAAVVAPLVLSDYYEYPAAIALACLAREKVGVVRADRAPKTDVVHVVATAALALGAGFLVPWLDIQPAPLAALLTLAPAAIYAYRWMPLRRRYSLCLLAIVAAGALLPEHGDRRLSMRSFFGVLRVVDQPGERHLLHGTTLHGSQRLGERDACVPTTYYVEDGPLGWAFEAHRARGGYGRTVAIGLGTGAAACFAAPDEPWRFIEINPDVITVARDPRWFTYLAHSPSDRVDVALGDGRIRLREEPDASLAFLFVDAFNSDSVPVHLLTREAVRLYLDKLEPGAWAVLHISNRVLDLGRVVADAVAAEGGVARIAVDDDAVCALIARREEDVATLGPRWRPLEGEASRAWTDSFSSLFSALGAREE